MEINVKKNGLLNVADILKYQEKRFLPVARKTAQEHALFWQDAFFEGSLLELKPGQVLFYEGHWPCGLFILLSGEIVLEEKLETHFRLAGKIPPFVPFGADLVLLERPYPCTARVERQARVFFLPKTLVKEGEIHKVSH